ncbi:MAG: hypothetical protein JXR22_12245 [Prolixibacteraceae bacterium]|nr:hypothetical protein [Prolixibacteraceae bacterium]
MRHSEPSAIAEKEEVQQETHCFVAGQLQLMLENGCIRWIRLGNTEIVRMIYLAVRDHNWGTLDATIEHLNFWQTNEQFDVSFTMQFGQPTVFEAACSITGQAANAVKFSFEGRMLADFLSNRIGFCVLHPVEECKGQPCKITHTNVDVEQGSFPAYISPHQPFKDIKDIQWAPKGINAALSFSGDIFEMEDQRNWTDASFKTYCTPLEKPFPVLRKKGSIIEQAVELKVDKSMFQKDNMLNHDQTIKIEISGETPKPFPPVGAWYNPLNGPVSHDIIALLNKTGIRHLRFDINFNDKNWKTSFDQFLSDWRKWKIDVELTFHVKPEDYPDFLLILDDLSELKMQLKFIQFFSIGSKSTRIEEVVDFVQRCRKAFPETKIGAGTDYDFTEINRYRFNAELFDYIVYSICPQVHAFDNFSLIENLAAQTETVESAGAIYPGKLIHASVVSLLRRLNPDATEESASYSNDHFDRRQHTIFGAQWGIGSIKYLAESGTSFITQFALTGREGLFPGNSSDLNTKHSPYSYLLEIVNKYDIKEIVPVRSSNPILVDVVLLKNDEFHMLILINFSKKHEMITMNKLIKITGKLVLDRYTFLEYEKAGCLPILCAEKNVQNVFHHQLSVRANSIEILTVHVLQNTK